MKSGGDREGDGSGLTGVRARLVVPKASAVRVAGRHHSTPTESARTAVVGDSPVTTGQSESWEGGAGWNGSAGRGAGKGPDGSASRCRAHRLQQAFSTGAAAGSSGINTVDVAGGAAGANWH